MIVNIDKDNKVIEVNENRDNLISVKTIEIDENMWNIISVTESNCEWYYENGEFINKQFREWKPEEIIPQKKRLLDATDYQVIKALEKMFLGDTKLHKDRQSIRDLINELEQTNNGG